MKWAGGPHLMAAGGDGQASEGAPTRMRPIGSGAEPGASDYAGAIDSSNVDVPNTLSSLTPSSMWR